uniref:Uncharacterized protein n=1 Tax=Acrobeloides nanus TaxID=290746 RepID=A0A914E7J6_9BILA
MDVLRVHFAGLTMNVLCACVSQAIWSGFDASFLWIMCHEIFEAGTELLIASCILNGSIFLGSIIAATALRR